MGELQIGSRKPHDLRMSKDTFNSMCNSGRSVRQRTDHVFISDYSEASEEKDAISTFVVTTRKKENIMGTILLIILILVLIGALPTWSHSRSWGYGPSGITGLIVVVLIVMLLMGRL
jgi:hypothetical protein